MKFYKILFVSLSLLCFTLSAAEFTICSYNCGALSEHYDYLRAASMQKLMQERHDKEPAQMAMNENIQKLALKILFSTDSCQKLTVQQEWDQKGYEAIFDKLTADPKDNDSPNTSWHAKAEQMITSYKARPVTIFDEEVIQMLEEQKGNSPSLSLTIATMAKKIFVHHLKYDILCLQEADYLDKAIFPDHYDVLFAETSHSKNGIAWNKNRFELVSSLGNLVNRAFAVQLRDKENGKIVNVVSAHLSGCNPYYIQQDPLSGNVDSAKGDHELHTILHLLNEHACDLLLIGMDSNVTSLHPRLNIIKEAGFQIDYENYIEPTCTNPYQILNTRIDWIAVKSNHEVSIVNIPVLNVGLNNLQTNISDHKPIVAKIDYSQNCFSAGTAR